MSSENTINHGETVSVTVNGCERSLPVMMTVHDLLVELSLSGQVVAVEINRDLVPKREHETHRISDGDEVELLTLVGGG